MPFIEEAKLRDLLTEKFFGDGPPRWIVNRGRPWERWCRSAEDSAGARSATLVKLRSHLPSLGTTRMRALIAKLTGCRAGHRCLSGACPECQRAAQRWFVRAGMGIGSDLLRRRIQPRFISIVPAFGRVPSGELDGSNVNELRSRTIATLRSVGIYRFRGALDVSLNHERDDRRSAYFQLHWWGLIGEPSGEAKRTRATRFIGPFSSKRSIGP